MNKCNFTGKLVRDPDTRISAAGTEVCKFTIVIDRKFKNAAGEKQADFISCISFKNNASFIAKWFKKGNWIEVSGSMQSGSYTNKDGAKVNTMDCIVDEAGFVGAKAVDNSPAAAPAFAGSEPAPSFAPGGGDSFGPLTEEDTSLPFDL
jgi:single-strand DNA-binding protein